MTKNTEQELVRFYNAEESLISLSAILDNVLNYRIFALRDCFKTFEDEKQWYVNQVFLELSNEVKNPIHIKILTRCVELLLEHSEYYPN
jgi:hypothetical protein